MVRDSAIWRFVSNVNDYAAITADWNKGGTDYNGLIVGQWIDYNEDGYCIVDENGDGFIDPANETTLDQELKSTQLVIRSMSMVVQETITYSSTPMVWFKADHLI